jgi:hypothetical protein
VLGGDNPEQTAASIRAAAVAIPFVALTYTWLGGSRGLKVMRHTLYVQWVAQPLLWIVLMLVLWRVIDKTEAVAVWAYAGSWIIAAIGAWFFWNDQPRLPGRAGLGLPGTIVRYGARGTAALLSQGLFWIDFFVASAFVASGYVTSSEIGVYSACVRAALIMVLFLTAVSYVFAPFVADLHERGETARLDTLFKTITRWTIAGTVPVLLLMLVVPAAILAMFGKGDFASGADALRITVIGQASTSASARRASCDHGRTHRMGPGRLCAVGDPRPRAVAAADPEVRHQRRSGRTGDHDRVLELVAAGACAPLRRHLPLGPHLRAVGGARGSVRADDGGGCCPGEFGGVVRAACACRRARRRRVRAGPPGRGSDRRGEGRDAQRAGEGAKGPAPRKSPTAGG